MSIFNKNKTENPFSLTLPGESKHTLNTAQVIKSFGSETKEVPRASGTSLAAKNPVNVDKLLYYGIE